MSSYVELTLFFVLGPEVDGVSPAVILYGEGILRPGAPEKPKKPQRSLGDGLYSLRSVSSHDALRELLTGREFKAKDKRFRLGLVARPPCRTPPSSIYADSAYHRIDEVSDLHAFVCEDKRGHIAEFFSADLDKRRDEAKRLAAAITRLQRFTGIDLWGRHARLLGDVLVYIPESGRAIGCKFVAGGAGVEITLDRQHVTHQRLMFNVRLFGTDGEVVADVLRAWDSPNDDTLVFRANQRLGRACVRVWSDGSLVYQKDVTAILQTEFGLGVRSAGYTISDRLARFVKTNTKHGRADAATLKAIQNVTPSDDETVVIRAERDVWRAEERQTGIALSEVLTPPAEAGALFPEGGAGRGEAISQLLQWIQGSSEVWIVDPFFGEEAAEALLPRITGSCRLRIVTSVPSDSAESTAAIVRTLRRLPRWMLPAGLQILQMTRMDGTQAFHDRFVACIDGDGSLAVYMLSNSLSGAARNYPLVVTTVPPRAALAILHDIEEAAGSGILFERQVQCETLWPIAGVSAQSAPVVHPRRQGPLPRMLLAAMSGAARHRSWIQSWSEGGWTCTSRSEDIRTIVHTLLPVERPARRGQGRRSSAVARAERARQLAGVWTLATLATHGLALSPRELAERGLPAFVSVALAGQLRQGYRRVGQSPARSLHEEALRAGLRFRPEAGKQAVFAQLILGLRLWSDTGSHLDVWGGDYDRRFIWATLSWLHPERAVAAAEACGDLGFVRVLLDEQMLPAPFPRRLADALLRSRWAALRGLAIQMLATPECRQHFSPYPDPPATEDGLRAVLRSGLPEGELVNVLSCWVRSSGPSPDLRLVDAVVDLLERQGPCERSAVMAQIFEWPARPRRWALRRMSARASLAEAVVSGVAARVIQQPKHISMDAIFSAVRAITTVAGASGRARRAVFDEAVDLAALELDATPASPLYSPPGHNQKVLAFVFAALMHDAAGVIDPRGFEPPVLDRAASAANRHGIEFQRDRAQALRLVWRCRERLASGTAKKS